MGCRELTRASVVPLSLSLRLLRERQLIEKYSGLGRIKTNVQGTLLLEVIMKITRIGVGLCFLSILTGSALAQKVYVDWDKTNSFANYKTYAWGNNTPTKDPLMDQRIQQGIDMHLAAKGLTKVDANSNPDLLVRYHVGTETQQQLNTFGDGWGWWGGGMSTTTVQNITTGQLMVDIGDVKKKILIWRGTADDTISNNPEKVDKAINKALTKMFEKFPPPSPK